MQNSFYENQSTVGRCFETVNLRGHRILMVPKVAALKKAFLLPSIAAKDVERGGLPKRRPGSPPPPMKNCRERRREEDGMCACVSVLNPIDRRPPTLALLVKGRDIDGREREREEGRKGYDLFTPI